MSRIVIVGLATLPPSMSRLSRQCGIYNISQPYRSPRPITGKFYFKKQGNDTQKQKPEIKKFKFILKKQNCKMRTELDNNKFWEERSPTRIRIA
jgi:hypothetical protein